MVSKGNEGNEDEFSLEDFEDDTVGCSWNFVAVCIAMPFMNGQVNALLTPAYTLHFQEMGWPVVRAGLAMSLGFALRVLTQQVLLRTGYWMVVPLCVVNMVFGVLAIFFNTSEWAVFGQLIVIYGIDAAVAIEGISFDSFGDSENKARQAASFTLATFTMSVALSCSIGGIIYDTLGWVGLAGYHTLCQGILILLLCLQGACRQSFMMNFFGAKDPEKDTDDQPGGLVFVRVMPTGPVTSEAPPLPGALENMEVLDVIPEGQDSQVLQSLASGASENQGRASRISSEVGRARFFSDPEDQVGQVGSKLSKHESLQVVDLDSDTSPRIVSTLQSGNSNRGRGGKNIHSSIGSRGSGRLRDRGSLRSSRSSASSGKILTYSSGSSRLSLVSRFSETAQLLSYSFANKSLQPQIIGATGSDAMPRYSLEMLNDMIEQDDATQPSTQNASPSRAGIPKDIRFPAFLIVMNSLVNNMAYVMEFATFAIFFREVHRWDQATWASLAQTSGDVAAAIAIQALSRFSGTSYDEAEAGCLRGLVHQVTSSPYNLSCLLSSWILLNLGMISPVLPLAIAAQVVMGTVYVYSMKWTNDMNLFYSLGEPQVFMSLQVMTKNAEAIGGALGGVVGVALYSWFPWAPFALGACIGSVAFVLYTAGFCSRLGCVDDIEIAEAKRARNKGLRRVKSWKA